MQDHPLRKCFEVSLVVGSRALRMSINRNLRDIHCDVAVMDCVRVNHCRHVVDCLSEETGVEAHPSAQRKGRIFTI